MILIKYIDNALCSLKKSGFKEVSGSRNKFLTHWINGLR